MRFLSLFFYLKMKIISNSKDFQVGEKKDSRTSSSLGGSCVSADGTSSLS